MPQALLPDVNTAIIKWRNKVVTALESYNYTAVLGALHSFNGDLRTEKYQVKISTEVYREKLAVQKTFIVCPSCEERTEYERIKIRRIITNPVVVLVGTHRMERVWVCPKCQAENLVERSDMLEGKLPNPIFLGVVPDPPERKDGIMDRKEFHKKFESWAWTFLAELEHSAARLREDWATQHHDDVGIEIQGGEEQDD